MMAFPHTLKFFSPQDEPVFHDMPQETLALVKH